MHKQNYIRYSTGISLLIPLILIQLFVAQLDIVLWINSYHQPVLDAICAYGTFLGDGWFIVSISLILFFFKPRMAFVLLLTYLISSGVTQSLKHFVFPQYHRPLWYLEAHKELAYYVAPGTDVSYNFSFPSGHTTSAFAFFGSLYFFSASALNRQIWIVLAFFTGFTRMYLLQHYLVDVTVGAFIGFSAAFLIYTFWLQTGKLDFIFKKLRV